MMGEIGNTAVWGGRTLSAPEAGKEPFHVPSRYLPMDFDFGAVSLGRVGWEVDG